MKTKCVHLHEESLSTPFSASEILVLFTFRDSDLICNFLTFQEAYAKRIAGRCTLCNFTVHRFYECVGTSNHLLHKPGGPRTNVRVFVGGY